MAASIIASSGAADPATSQISTGLSCSPSCRQVMISIVSSNVPSPPGIETKASASSNIRVLRTCMVSVTISSDTPGCATSRRVRKSGITPITRPPACSAASATAPISPTRPPPKISVLPARASPSPNASAARR